MIVTRELDKAKPIARAISKCNGAMIFAVGGSIWLVLSAFLFAALRVPAFLAIAGIAALLIVTALCIQKRAGKTGESAYTEEEQRKTGRTYMIVNLITWVGAFLAVNILGNTGHSELSLSAVIVIVGLHLFFMPPAYRHRVNTTAGACMIVWAILASILFHGQTIAGAVTLGAGLILWLSSAWAIKNANNSLRAQGL